MSGRRGPILARLRTAAASAATLAIACGSGAPDVQRGLILSVDTLRADRLGAHGSVLGLTPHLDALGAESLVFDAAYAPSAHTLPSIAALMTGRYPQELGITGNLSIEWFTEGKAHPLFADRIFHRHMQGFACVTEPIEAPRT